MLHAWSQPVPTAGSSCTLSPGTGIPAAVTVFARRRDSNSAIEENQARDLATKAFCSPNGRLTSAESRAGEVQVSHALLVKGHPPLSVPCDEKHLLLLSRDLYPAFKALRNLAPLFWSFISHPYPHKLPALAKAGNLMSCPCTAWFPKTTCPWQHGPLPPPSQSFSGPGCSITSMKPPLAWTTRWLPTLYNLFYATFSHGQILHFSEIPKRASHVRVPLAAHTKGHQGHTWINTSMSAGASGSLSL